jgi:hypothetical protein
MSDVERNVDLFRRLEAAYNARDIDAIRKLVPRISSRTRPERR